jgi:hypothetical protein
MERPVKRISRGLQWGEGCTGGARGRFSGTSDEEGIPGDFRGTGETSGDEGAYLGVGRRELKALSTGSHSSLLRCSLFSKQRQWTTSVY